MKKILALFIATILLMANSISAFAVELPSEPLQSVKTPSIDEETQYYAYLDIEEAKKDIKAKILVARSEIIYKQGWSDDNFSLATADSSGNITKVHPKFSDLFPNWDIPNLNEVYAAKERIKGKEQLNIQKYAYMDEDKAMASIEKKILDARKEIIYSKSWVADDYEGHIENIDTGEIVEVLPSFSELFPDWDIPIQNFNDSEITPYSSETYKKQIYLHTPGSVMSQPFFSSWTTGVKNFTVFASRLPGTTCNIGFTNMNTNRDIGYHPYLRANERAILGNENHLSIPIGIRASSNGVAGSATMIVIKNTY